MAVDFITENGRKRVVLDAADYEELLDIRDASLSMRDIAKGAATLSGADMDAYLAAPTPLAFWRKRRGLTQLRLASSADITQPFLAQLEAGQRVPSADTLRSLATALDVRMEDLIED